MSPGIPPPPQTPIRPSGAVLQPGMNYCSVGHLRAGHSARHWARGGEHRERVLSSGVYLLEGERL